MIDNLNRQILLASRPSGSPGLENFRLKTAERPKLGEGEVLLRTKWLSIEPYMRVAMEGLIMDLQGAKGPPGSRLGWTAQHILTGVGVGEPMGGATIAEVVESRDSRFAEGDVVLSYNGWQEFAIADGENMLKLDDDLPYTVHLGVLGVPGLTAYAGIDAVGQPKPGDVVVVSAAAGAVGSVAAQIALAQGARVIGIVSGDQKVRYLQDELGLHGAIDRLAPDFADQLAKACPEGVDIFVDCAGGAVFWATFPLIKDRGRIVILGVASKYAGTPQESALETTDFLESVFMRRLTITTSYWFERVHLEPEFHRDVSAWIKGGKFKYKEHIVDGLENAPQALLDVLRGKNDGKMIVRVS